MSQDYNGWIGYGDKDSAWATWCMSLWIDNEEWIYKEKMRFIRHHDARGTLDADMVKDFCLSIFPNGPSDFHEYDDPEARKRHLSNVNWEEILEHWKAEIEE